MLALHDAFHSRTLEIADTFIQFPDVPNNNFRLRESIEVYEAIPYIREDVIKIRSLLYCKQSITLNDRAGNSLTHRDLRIITRRDFFGSSTVITFTSLLRRWGVWRIGPGVGFLKRDIVQPGKIIRLPGLNFLGFSLIYGLKFNS